MSRFVVSYCRIASRCVESRVHVSYCMSEWRMVYEVTHDILTQHTIGHTIYDKTYVNAIWHLKLLWAIPSLRNISAFNCHMWYWIVLSHFVSCAPSKCWIWLGVVFHVSWVTLKARYTTFNVTLTRFRINLILTLKILSGL